ncbi:MAG: DUF4105 domain-containing protein [Bacteriovoracaceae bacterium]|nr:DUF4105 domain-containing protein [Bacteriovoracaceae bacterium]
MILKFLFIFTCLIQIAEAKDFSDLVDQYVKINQEKIKIVDANRHRLKGVEIIIADKADSLASRFGHGMLRLIDDDSTWVNDAVISFSALSYEENYSLRRSLVGGYTIIPQVMTMFEYWNMYTKDEERNLKRYVINLDQRSLNQLLNTLFKYLDDPKKLDNYTFLSNNCIAVITKIFIEAGVTKSKKTRKIPTSIGPWIEQNELTLYPEFVMKNYKSVNEKAKALNINQISKEELLEHFTAQELNYIYLNNNELSEEKVDFLAAYLKTLALDLDQTYSFNPIAQTLYSDYQKEQLLLKKSDLLDTIVYRLENKNQYLKKYLKHLNFKTDTLVSLKNQAWNYRSYQFKRSHDEIYLVIELRDNNSLQDFSEETIRMPFQVKGNKVFFQGKMAGLLTDSNTIEFMADYRLAVQKDSRNVEFKMISL